MKDCRVCAGIRDTVNDYDFKKEAYFLEASLNIYSLNLSSSLRCLIYKRPVLGLGLVLSRISVLIDFI